MKVYLLYRHDYYGGCNGWDRVQDVFTDSDKAEWERIRLEELYGDDYISFYVEEYYVNESKLEDEQ